jgi:hypothetical protein
VTSRSRKEAAVDRTLVYWPEAADDPAVADLLDGIEFGDIPGPEDPDEDDAGTDEGDEWAPEVPEGSPENQLD